jgi:hypothetical protein
MSQGCSKRCRLSNSLLGRTFYDCWCSFLNARLPPNPSGCRAVSCGTYLRCLVAGCCSGRTLPGSAHSKSSHRFTTRDNLVHFIGGLLLFCILLRVLSQSTGPRCGSGLFLASRWCRGARCFFNPLTQHYCIAVLCNQSDLGPPQAFGPRQKWCYLGVDINVNPGGLFYISPGRRVP